MPRSIPSISLIVIRRGHANSLQPFVRALLAQTYPLAHVELLIIGETDPSELEQTQRLGLVVRGIEQAWQGDAAAGNIGAAHANGELLVFSTDDVLPAPQYLSAYATAYSAGADAVVGRYMYHFPRRPSMFQLELRSWWEHYYQDLGTPGHRFSYRDLCIETMAVSAGMFTQLGGFNPRADCGADQEFGVRLLESGAMLVYADQARVSRAIKRSDNGAQGGMSEGQADVWLSTQHASLLPSLPLAAFDTPKDGLEWLARSAAFAHPLVGQRLIHVLHRALALTEHMHLRRYWRKFAHLYRSCWYWRGVASTIGSAKSLRRLIASANDNTDQPHELAIDLGLGLAAAQQQLDSLRPQACTLTYGSHVIGRLPAVAGAEQLRGVHLRHALATELAEELSKVLEAQPESAIAPYEAQTGMAAAVGSLDVTFTSHMQTDYRLEQPRRS